MKSTPAKVAKSRIRARGNILNCGERFHKAGTTPTAVFIRPRGPGDETDRLPTSTMASVVGVSTATNIPDVAS